MRMRLILGLMIPLWSYGYESVDPDQACLEILQNSDPFLEEDELRELSQRYCVNLDEEVISSQLDFDPTLKLSKGVSLPPVPSVRLGNEIRLPKGVTLPSLPPVSQGNEIRIQSSINVPGPVLIWKPTR